MWNRYYNLKITGKDIKRGKHKDLVGGMWEEMGKLQLDWLLRNGLRPEHNLLDIGCGSLRGGVYFIDYLNQGRYFGLDINKSLIEAGKKELQKAGLNEKNPTLLVNDSFQFNLLNTKFDFAIAQSVFTHLPANVILRCLINVDRVLNPGGKFYATFFETKERYSLKEINQSDGIVTHLDQDPYHYHYSFFGYLVDNLSLHLEYIGNWGHPRNQKMLCFTKE